MRRSHKAPGPYDAYKGFRQAAERIVPPAVFARVHGGAGSNRTGAHEREALKAVRLVPHLGVDTSAGIDTSSEMLGVRTTVPYYFSAAGTARFLHPDGERAAAKIAAERGLRYALSTVCSVSPEEIYGIVGNLGIFQLYMLRDWGATREILERVKLAGFKDLMLTVDVPVAGERTSELRWGFTSPLTVPKRYTSEWTEHSFWWDRYVDSPPVELALFQGLGGVRTSAIGQFTMDRTFENLRRPIDWWRTNVGGKVTVKGVLRDVDVRAFAMAGANGAILTTHGHRQLDGSVVAMDTIGVVVDRVQNEIGDDFEIGFDGGIRDGGDIVRALASGASCVGIGRGYLYGLMVDGEPGVGRVEELVYKRSLENVMHQIGAPTVGALDRSFVSSAPLVRGHSSSQLGLI